MHTIFDTPTSRDACWDVKPAWIILAAKKARHDTGSQEVPPTNYRGAFRIGIEEYAFATEQYMLSPWNRALNRALVETLVLAIDDFQIRVYNGSLDYAEGHSICFSLHLLSTSEDFLLGLEASLKGDSDEGAFGMFDHFSVATISVLKLFVGVKGLLISEAAAAFYSATQMLCGSLRGRILNKEVVA
jgi:hypothetical protein